MKEMATPSTTTGHAKYLFSIEYNLVPTTYSTPTTYLLQIPMQHQLATQVDLVGFAYKQHQDPPTRSSPPTRTYSNQ